MTPKALSKEHIGFGVDLRQGRFFGRSRVKPTVDKGHFDLSLVIDRLGASSKGIDKPMTLLLVSPPANIPER